ncbi:MAG: ABC transporter ATP-binding protein [Phycisphaerae bacterium]|jgi:ABC-2 type transport system ATP-binding protein
MDAIATHDLCKRYGSRDVLRSVNLSVPAGSLLGFLGPNGAGKTTTIRILLGLLRATSGRADVLGQDAWARGPRVRAEVGYLPGDVRFRDDRTGRELLEFFNRARGGRARQEMTRLQRAFDLDLDRRVRSYSRGMKQKLGLIQALMHRPRLVILDEPTTALDPLVRETLNDELRRAVNEGRTVLFSSHTLSEVEELCDHVAIVRDGRLIEQERVEVLRARAVRRVEITLDGDGATRSPAPPALVVSRRSGAALCGSWSGPVRPLLDWLAREAVRDVVIAPPDLEDLFLAYYDRRGDAP